MKRVKTDHIFSPDYYEKRDFLVDQIVEYVSNPDTKDSEGDLLWRIHILSLGMIDREWFEDDFQPHMTMRTYMERTLAELEAIWDEAGSLAIDGFAVHDARHFYNEAYVFAPEMIARFAEERTLSLLL